MENQSNEWLFRSLIIFFSERACTSSIKCIWCETDCHDAGNLLFCSQLKFSLLFLQQKKIGEKLLYLAIHKTVKLGGWTFFFFWRKTKLNSYDFDSIVFFRILQCKETQWLFYFVVITSLVVIICLVILCCFCIIRCRRNGTSFRLRQKLEWRLFNEMDEDRPRKKISKTEFSRRKMREK